MGDHLLHGYWGGLHQIALVASRVVAAEDQLGRIVSLQRIVDEEFLIDGLLYSFGCRHLRVGTLELVDLVFKSMEHGRAALINLLDAFRRERWATSRFEGVLLVRGLPKQGMLRVEPRLVRIALDVVLVVERLLLVELLDAELVWEDLLLDWWGARRFGVSSISWRSDSVHGPLMLLLLLLVRPAGSRRDHLPRVHIGDDQLRLLLLLLDVERDLRARLPCCIFKDGPAHSVAMVAGERGRLSELVLVG